MSNELWRTAPLRWGDPIFRLALLLTGNRADAAAVTVDAFEHMAAPPAPELALYTRLSRYRARRWRISRRQGVLPRQLARIAPADRLLLGLVLLRNTSGAHLTAIFNQQPAEIVARLEPIMAAARDPDSVQPPALGADSVQSADHLTLTQWLAYTLGFAPQHPDHLKSCAACRRAQHEWRGALDQWRARLHEIVGRERLPAATLAMIEMRGARADADVAPGAWWQQRRVWLSGLLASVGVLLLLMIVPTARPAAPAAQIPGPGGTSARDLVQQTLDGWGAPPDSGTRYQRVWAIDQPLRDGQAVVTDVWLAAGSAAHRFEVRSDSTLVEWQLGDGSATLQYAADPAFTACRWNTGYAGYRFRVSGAALRFAASAQEQRAARAARLQQGAYGTGYVALLRALQADDLRSFGAQTEGAQSLVVLQYTDRQTQPPQPMLLKIDPRVRQLYSVQQVDDAGPQVTPRELWRLEQEVIGPDEMPRVAPAAEMAEVQARLIDPACPSLNTEAVVSLRQIVGLQQRVALPNTLPPGITSAAVMLTSDRQRASELTATNAPDGLSVLLVGPGRWLSIARTPSLLSAPTADAITRGEWRVSVQEPSGVRAWRGTAFPANNRSGAPLQFWAAGWSREALLRVFATLAPVTLESWPQFDAAYLDPRPLDPAARAALFDAIAATRPQPNQSVQTLTSSVLRRVAPPLTPSDPYFMSYAAQFPARLQREQWLVWNNGAVAQLRDVTELPDGQPYSVLLSDGRAIRWYSRDTGTMWTDVPVENDLNYLLHEPSRELIAMLLTSDAPIRVNVADNMLSLEQPVSEADQRGAEWHRWRTYRLERWCSGS